MVMRHFLSGTLAATLTCGLAHAQTILPEMMRWLWRDHPVSTDPRDMTERSMRLARPTEPAKN
jgi:hypothetical protein